jgi:hypothetical protein
LIKRRTQSYPKQVQAFFNLVGEIVMATNDTTAKIEAYLGKQQQWHPQLLKLREVLGKSELEETVKWGGANVYP